MCVCFCVCTRANVLLTAGLLDRLHSDDPVCARGFLHPRGLRPDDCVGQRQTPQLLKGVQRLSDPALLYTPLHPVEPGRGKTTVAPHVLLLLTGPPPLCWRSLSISWMTESVRPSWMAQMGVCPYGLAPTSSDMPFRNTELQGCAFQEEFNAKVLMYFFCVSLNKEDEDYGTLVACYVFYECYHFYWGLIRDVSSRVVRHKAWSFVSFGVSVSLWVRQKLHANLCSNLPADGKSCCPNMNKVEIRAYKNRNTQQ